MYLYILLLTKIPVPNHPLPSILVTGKNKQQIEISNTNVRLKSNFSYIYYNLVYLFSYRMMSDNVATLILHHLILKCFKFVNR